MTIVRPATGVDTEAMGVLHVRAWQVGYADVMPAAYLDGLRAAERTEMWRRGIEDGRAHIIVSTDDDGTVRGFACAGLEREDGDVGELFALNVDPAAWGAGHGSALLESATAWLATQWNEAVLWVVDANPRARALYERAGWRADGTERSDEVLGAVVSEVRYRRSL
jgi:GNAT superfamily N-acetyltransferase